MYLMDEIGSRVIARDPLYPYRQGAIHCLFECVNRRSRILKYLLRLRTEYSIFYAC